MRKDVAGAKHRSRGRYLRRQWICAVIGLVTTVAVIGLAPILPSWGLGSIVAAAFALSWLFMRGHAPRSFRGGLIEEETLEDLVSELLQHGGPGWRNHLPGYLTVQNRDLRIVEMNDRFREEFGDVTGSHCYHAYKRRDSPCPDCPVLRTLADGKTHRSEETVVTDDGESANVVVTSVPLRNRRGELVAVMELSSNTSELAAVHRELDRSRGDFERLFDLVPCYISIQDRDFRVVETNEAFRRDFGEQSGSRCYQAYKSRDTVCPGCPVEKTLVDGEVHTSEELVVTRDGRQANVMVYSMPIHDRHGEIEAVMEVSANITEV